jgi:hypothetical protein
MSLNSDNHQRIFAEVVSVQAWHDSFDSKVSKADLSVDVVFGEARIGGEVVSPIRFKLELRRADLIVVIPETEPVSVDLSSLSRDAPLRKGRLTETVEQSHKAKIKGGSSVSAGAAGISASAKVEADAQAHIQTSTKRAISSDLPTMEVVLAPRTVARGTLYEGLDVKKCFGVSAITISSLPTFQEGGSRERSCALKAWQLLRLGGAERSSPEARRGAPLAARGLEGEGAARR